MAQGYPHHSMRQSLQGIEDISPTPPRLANRVGKERAYLMNFPYMVDMNIEWMEYIDARWFNTVFCFFVHIFHFHFRVLIHSISVDIPDHDGATACNKTCNSL
jgi:hypothetical protein